MIWRLASKNMLKFLPSCSSCFRSCYLSWFFSVPPGVLRDHWPKERADSGSKNSVCLLFHVVTHSSAAIPRDIHGMTTFAGCCWFLLPIFSPRKGDYCISLLHFCSKISLKNTASTGIQSFVLASRAVIKGISPHYSEHYHQLLWNLDTTKAKGLTSRICLLQRGFIISKFFFMYFTITGAKNVVRYRKEFVR